MAFQIPPIGSAIQSGEMNILTVTFGDGGDVEDPSVTGVVEFVSVDVGAHGKVRVFEILAEVSETFDDSATGTAAVTLTVGDGASAAGFFASADLAPGTADSVPISSRAAGEAYAAGRVYDEDDTIDIVVGGSVPGAAGLLELAIVYTVGIDD